MDALRSSEMLVPIQQYVGCYILKTGIFIYKAVGTSNLADLTVCEI